MSLGEADRSRWRSIHFIVACPCSGSTLLRRIFSESPACDTTSDLTSAELQATTQITNSDSSPTKDVSGGISASPVSSKKHLVFIPQLQNSTERLHTWDLLAKSFVHRSRPVYLIRDPVRVFDSWKDAGYTDIVPFIDCYADIIEQLNRTDGPDQACLYERLIMRPDVEVQRICDLWGLPFSEDMLNLNQPLDQTISSNEKGSGVDGETKGSVSTPYLHTSVISSSNPWHGQVSPKEIDHIERHLGPWYVRCWAGKATELHAVLAKKTWVFFDLDDTLHEFRKASSAATESAMQALGRTSGGIPVPDLKAKYAEVLAQKTSGAFVEGKTSHEYRRERFSAVMAHFSLPAAAADDDDRDRDRILQELLDTYETALTRALKLKPGAEELLMQVRAQGKKIAVVTEGPQDAQERALAHLGLADRVDFLATTNRFRVAKTDGLFGHVLRHLGVDAADVACVGDSVARDMVPAAAAGIFSVHLDERANVDFDACPPRINTLHKLRFIMSEGA